MEIFITVVGWLVVLAASIAFALWALFAMLVAWHRLLDKFINRVEMNTRRDVGERLIRTSYWFSEKEAAYIAVRLIGQSLVESGFDQVEKTRDRWRDHMSGKNPFKD